MSTKIYDLIGIGAGPFNLGLACLSEPLEQLETLFLDQKEEFDWHGGIMLEWSTLQIPFIADFVSFADPTNKFSFLNYLKKHNRLYQYYIRESFFTLRSEYNDYCKWVISQLNNIKFKHQVDTVEYNEKESVYLVSGTSTDGHKFEFLAKKLILGTGTVPEYPEFCKNLAGDVHLGANYLDYRDEYQHKKSITIIGSGQSSAEIYYDLLQNIDKHKYKLNWLTMSDRFYSMDLGKLSLEYTSPDYTQYFYSLSDGMKDDLIAKQEVLFKGINIKLISEIYDLLYLKSSLPNFNTQIIPNAQLQHIQKSNDLFNLEFKHLQKQKNFVIESEAVILATGYGYQLPSFLNPIKDVLNWDSKGRLVLANNYSVADNNTIFAQNLGLYTHGISVPDLGMACYRNSIILNTILDKEVYPVEEKTAFQVFDPINL